LGLTAVVVSGVAGCFTVALVARRRYGSARVTAAIAVAAIIAGWGLAQRPQFLPGLTIEEAAAGRSTLVAVLVALAVGAVVLIPSLGLLFSLVLRGLFDEGVPPGSGDAAPGTPGRTQALLSAAGACLLVGIALTVPVESPWGRILGVPLLFGFIVLGFVALATSMAAAQAEEDSAAWSSSARPEGRG
jgi:cytochrome d ubiquinol oxidase subunit II